MADNSMQQGAKRLPFALPSSQDEDLIPWLKLKHEQGRPVTSDAQMKLNLAYVLGYQWVIWNKSTRSYQRPSVSVSDPNAPVRLKSNKIATLVERHIAKITKDAPVPEARPVSDDDDDMDSAKVGTRILEHELDRLDWNHFLQKFEFWPTTIGWGYIHVRWDATSGDQVADDDDGALFSGEIEIEEVPPFELNVDPSAQSMRTAKWAVRTTSMTAEEVWTRWDVELMGDGARPLTQEVYALGGQDNQNRGQEQWIKVHQFWAVPSKIAPEGAVITWAQGKVLERKTFPYDHKTLPFVQGNCLPGLGTREGRTFVTDLLDLQTDYNDALSREATIRRTLTPKLIAATGQVSTDRLRSRVEVIPYNAGISSTPPHLEMPNAAWAQQFEMGMERADKDMGDRAGINEVSQGNAATSAPAASILALQDADDTKLRITVTEMATMIAEVGRQILLLAKQYWSDERTVRVWSEENHLAVYHYSGTDIDERLDIHIDTESSMPKSKAAQAQLALELQARFPQAIGLPEVTRFLGNPGLDSFIQTTDVDTRRQLRENSMMLEGKDCEVQAFDNHQIHLQVLNDFRKTRDYERLELEARAIFDAHAGAHEGLVLQQLGVNIPSGTGDPEAAAQAQTAMAGAGAQGAPVDPAAAPAAPGADPNAMSDGSIQQQAQIGQAAGQPGAVPGVPADQQAASMGH